MIDDIAPGRTRLADPAPPATLSATVMARIAREADRRGAPAVAEAVPARSHGDWPAWLWTLTGLAMVFCASAWRWLVTGALPDLTSPRIGRDSLALAPIEGPAVLFLGFGLLLYLAGLFAPLRSRIPR
jgi:hypothetical protein